VALAPAPGKKGGSQQLRAAPAPQHCCIPILYDVKIEFNYQKLDTDQAWIRLPKKTN